MLEITQLEEQTREGDGQKGEGRTGWKSFKEIGAVGRCRGIVAA